LNAPPASYDQAAVLQREISNRMLGRLEYIKYQPDVILDAGSGTGYGSQQLAKRYPNSQLIAVDIAWAMLIARAAEYRLVATLAAVAATAQRLCLRRYRAIAVQKRKCRHDLVEPCTAMV
jgi:trans-aconitate methyltransferase